MSDDYVVTLGGSRQSLAEWATLVDKRAEIQVRTATQHAWAAIEHKLRYKSTVDVSDDLERRLSRPSALFELADEQFSLLRQETTDLERRYVESLRSGDLQVPLDSSSLAAYLAESDVVREALGIAVERGMVISDVESEEDSSRQARDRTDLLKVLADSGIETSTD